MASGDKKLDIAVGFVDLGGPVRPNPAILNAITSLTGIPPRRVQLPGSAGPNGTLELLADPATWIALAVSGGILSELGKDIYRVAVDKIKALREKKSVTPLPAETLAILRESLKQDFQSYYDPVLFGYQAPKVVPRQNIIGVQINEASDREIAKAAAALALNGDAIHQELELIAADPTIENLTLNFDLNDMGNGAGAAFRVNDDMSIDAPLIIHRAAGIERIHLTFTADGKVVKK